MNIQIAKISEQSLALKIQIVLLSDVWTQTHCICWLQTLKLTDYTDYPNYEINYETNLNAASNVLTHPATKGIEAAIHSNQAKLTPCKEWLTNQRPVFGSGDQNWQMRSQYSDQVICFDQTEAIIFTWAPSYELWESKSRPVDCKPKMCQCQLSQLDFRPIRCQYQSHMANQRPVFSPPRLPVSCCPPLRRRQISGQTLSRSRARFCKQIDN